MSPAALESRLRGAAPRWLASVLDPAEAVLARDAGADVVDAKDPRAGALGALAPRQVRAIRDALGAGTLLSATTGDLPAMPPAAIEDAARAVLQAGADVAKVALYPAPQLHACIEGLAPLAREHALVGVVLADRLQGPCAPRHLDSLLRRMAGARWCGVMLDTADKREAPLPRLLGVPRLREFVDLAHAHGLLCGLAGSLRLQHVGELAPLRPDLLGFRGALCRASLRTAGIDPARLAEVASAMRARALEPAPAP